MLLALSVITRTLRTTVNAAPPLRPKSYHQCVGGQCHAMCGYSDIRFEDLKSPVGIR